MLLIHFEVQVFTSVQLSSLIKNTSRYHTESFLTKGHTVQGTFYIIAVLKSDILDV